MGLLRGVARTAVIAGTATAVSNNVSRRQARRWSDQAEQQAYEEHHPGVTDTDEDDAMDQLEKLASLKDKGILTQEEFDAKKKQILGL
jgi:hypothetical protein